MTATTPTVLDARVKEAAGVALPAADVARAEVIGRGWDVVAWRVPAGDGDWVFRVPRLPSAIPTIEAQTRLGARLAAEGFPVPLEPGLLKGPGGETLAGLYRYVDGRPARVRGRGARRRLAHGLADLVSRLHALDPQVGIDCGAVPKRPWDALYGPMIERCAPLLPPRTAAWVRAIGARLEAASTALPRLVVVHQDLKPAHVMIDEEDAIAGVLDFEGVQVTDPAADFARVMQNWDPAFARLVLSEYRGHVDPDFMTRARCYTDLDPLDVFRSSLDPEYAEWRAPARRTLASCAAAASRAARQRA